MQEKRLMWVGVRVGVGVDFFQAGIGVGVGVAEIWSTPQPWLEAPSFSLSMVISPVIGTDTEAAAALPELYAIYAMQQQLTSRLQLERLGSTI